MAAFKTFFLFTPDFEMICSNPILAQYLPNSAQVLSWTYCLIINWLRQSNLLKGSRYCTCAAQLVHVHKKFQVNRTKIKGGCQSETKAAQQHSCIDFTL